MSDVEAELHDVAVGHHVVLALHADRPASLAFSMEPSGDEVVEGDDFGLDEAALEVGVDDAGGLGAVAPFVIVQARDSLGPAVR